MKASNGFEALEACAALIVLPLSHLTAALLLAGCVLAPVAPQANTTAWPVSPPATLVFSQPVVLLGEVHDHAGQHALRVAAFRAHVAAGARPALLMEQFDRQHQAAIDAAPRSTDAVIAAGQGGPGWKWDFYRPFIDVALAHGLPIVAVNIGREEARRVMREGLAASGFVADVPTEVSGTLASMIVSSHCGMVDETTAGRMALAQVARDQHMARAVGTFAARGVVLLAGNGHVRTDVGAPRWLDATTRARSEAIGILEDGDTTTAFDRRLFTPPQMRPDPCDAMRNAAPAASR
jgi:uncharacterized iron-regulated protein